MNLPNLLMSLCVLIDIFTVTSIQSYKVTHYGSLIKDVHDKYKMAGVIIGSSRPHISFEIAESWHETSRMLSNKGLSAVIVNFKELQTRLKVYTENTQEPLIVIAIDTIRELHVFQTMTTNIHMGYAHWLVIFSPETEQDVCKFCRNPQGNSLNLKFNSKVFISCCGTSMIEEWWSIKENHTKRQEIGRLINENREIVWFNHVSLHNNRYSMGGRVLRVAAVNQSHVYKMNGVQYGGFLGELLDELSYAINFKISKIIWDNAHGARKGNTSHWTGIVGRVIRREVDIGAAPFLMTHERSEVIRFTTPFFAGYYQLHFKKIDPNDVLWNAHFNVFPLKGWAFVIGFMSTPIIFLMLIKYNKERSHFFPILYQQFTRIWGIYCQQGLPNFPAETTQRIIYISIFLSALITSAAYSAGIVSSLMTPSHLQFTTMEQFVEDGTYGLIVLVNSPDYNHFKLSNETLMMKMMSLMMPIDSLPQSVDEAFDQICHNRVAFYTHELAKLDRIDSLHCEVTSIKAGELTSTAMIVPKDSEYIELINHYIQRFTSNGILNRLRRKHHMQVPGRQQVDFQPVPLQGIASVGLALGIGVLIAIIIFIIERLNFSLAKKLPKK